MGNDCQTSLLKIAIESDVDECGLIGADPLITFPGTQRLQCSPALQGLSRVALSLVVVPTAEVECSMTSETREAAVAAGKVRFEKAARPSTSASLAIAGTPDLQYDPSTPFSIQASCVSADARFDKALTTAAARVTDVHFPRVSGITPVTVVPYQTMVVSSDDFPDASFEVKVGDVLVSQQPVIRTVLLNETEGSLWEVSFDDDNVTSWEHQLSSAFEASVPWLRKANLSTPASRRRVESNAAPTPSSTYESTTVLQAGSAPDTRALWYPYWRSYELELIDSGLPVAFCPADGFAGLKLWMPGDTTQRWSCNTTSSSSTSDTNGAMLNVSSPDGPLFHLPASAIIRRQQVPPGPLLVRQVLGAARVGLPNGTEFTIVREYAQRYTA